MFLDSHVKQHPTADKRYRASKGDIYVVRPQPFY